MPRSNNRRKSRIILGKALKLINKRQKRSQERKGTHKYKGSIVNIIGLNLKLANQINSNNVGDKLQNIRDGLQK